MATAAQGHDGRTGAGRRFLTFLMSKLTSRHGKRMIFVTSLYLHLARYEKLQADAISHLNDVMRLATNEKALSFPAHISGLVWTGADINGLILDAVSLPLAEERAKAISVSLVERAPSWVRYGSESVMVKDVYDLIRDVVKPEQGMPNGALVGC